MKRKVHILTVDDEPVISESLTYVLEAPHREIVSARDGQEALTLAAKNQFDFLITDHRMPKAGGLELVRQMRQRGFHGKVVIISAHLSPENIGAYEDLAIDEILEKPFDFKELRDIVARLEEEP